jgi:hypothetical protein
MAEERTLGLARAPERNEEEDPSKEELQARMEEARDSISQTVTEIKETVAQQYETVKEALDWREHFKKRPLAWSLGAAGAGFFIGYGIAAALKGESDQVEEYGSSPHAYASQPILGERSAEIGGSDSRSLKTNGDKDDGPGLIGRFKETRAFDRLQQEVGSLGDRLVEELSTTAQVVVLPALLRKVRQWIGADLSDKSSDQRKPSEIEPPAASMRAARGSSYEPSLERNPS